MRLKALIFAFILIAILSPNSYAQLLPERPLEGRMVFEEKGCVNCHSIDGSGGQIGPDLGAYSFSGTGFDLVSRMWNHSPKMLSKMGQMNIKRAEFTPEDFQNLQTFLYFLRYLGKSGSVAKGREIFTQKKCILCHVIGKEDASKVRLDKIKVYASPLFLAQSMWNHAIQMHRRLKSLHVTPPTFTGNEFADLSIYIRAVSTLGEREEHYMYPGSPKEGEELFKSKQCYFCHVEKKIGPDLRTYNMNKSVTEIAGMMWNHAEKMEEMTEKFKIPWPTFKGDEMANLISYLYFMNPPKISGSKEEGRRLFQEKGCIKCHYPDNPYKAPPIAEKKPFHSENAFFAALWNHAPRMEEILYSRGEGLPQLSASGVKSLYLYLNPKANK